MGRFLSWPGTSGDAINLDNVLRYAIGEVAAGKVTFTFVGGGTVTLQIASTDADAETVMDRLVNPIVPADLL